MLRKLNVRRAFLFLCLFFCFTKEVFSQVTITAENILSIYGKTLMNKTDTTVTINVGSPGPNQTWDFSMIGTFIPPNSDSCKLRPDKCRSYTKQEYLVPSGTPFENGFPQANLVQKSIPLSTPDTTVFTYFSIKDSFSLNLGTGLKWGNKAFVFLQWDSTKRLRWPLPMKFENSWYSKAFAKVFIFSFEVGNISINSSSKVDAWGTVALPGDTMECLRICTHDTTIYDINAPPFVVRRDTIRTISYTWVSPKYYIVATATSKDGETNPTFTVAGSFQRVDVKEKSEHAEIPAGFELSRNFPNPFNPTTTIRYGLPKAARVTLKIYNLLGTEVATLVKDEPKATGYHVAIWDGRNEVGGTMPSGVYFVQIRAGTFVQTRKMLLIE